MAIVKLKKLTFCGLIEDKAKVLEQLQTLGNLHLISQTSSKRARERDGGKQSDRMIEALRYLHSCPNKRHQAKHAKTFHVDQVVDEVLKLKSKIRELSDRFDLLQKRIRELEPWGDFRLPEAGLLAEQRLWFYIIPKRMMKQLRGCNQVWQTVYQNNLFCYVVVISETEPPEHALPVSRTHTGSQPLSALEEQRSELELSLEDLQAQRESLTRWIALLTLHFNESVNLDDLKQAQTLTRDEAGVFALQGWLPENYLQRYLQFAEAQGLAVLVEEPTTADTPPTLLVNPPLLAGGEDLVNFYQTPNYQGWDPSLMVFFSFALFFAIITSDAGYAAVFAGILAVKWRRLGQNIKGRRIRVLAATAILLSIIWGILCGSYFGYGPQAGGILETVQVFDLKDFDGMMRFSIAVGVIHIALANLIKAWQLRASSQALAPIGWIAMVSGGFCYWLGMDSGTGILQTTGQVSLGLGALLLLLFSSERKVKHWSDWFWRSVTGVESLINITKLFGDVLSYMRLFALGLAGASLALTFNNLAEQVFHALPGPGLFFAILIFVLGHALNLLLCILSGLVHGLRLNFIEFYNWSVSDEGYPFKAFSKKGVNS
ncbi:V-type ATP synthase subunit I [Methylomonas rivi]|uniref:ATPase n=1 Tax=Methylomonas rivi TaxID=2952226 RepID=A0ABT1U3J3_9GAMM|nr:ATPase [Methylomonas sp. WSC-6]MCQ8128407.1 ATPase [Methylomonas sp. WSC-6]